MAPPPSWTTSPLGSRFDGMKAGIELERVRSGQLSSLKYRSAIQSRLARCHISTAHSGMDLSRHTVQMNTTHVTSADLESVDHKYLVCGLSDGGVGIYDTTTASYASTLTYRMEGSVVGGQRGSHTQPVDCVQWYPADAGLFTTSSRGKKVKIWDPNRLVVVDQFIIDCNVQHHHMSPIATKHSLLAVGGDSGEVILCDMRTGTSTHRLQGHEGPVSVTQWSPRQQHVLASCGYDCTVRIWDVRSSRALLMALDGGHKSGNSYQKAAAHRGINKTPKAHRSQVSSLCFTHDGLWLLTYAFDGLKLWNSSTGEKMNVKYPNISPKKKTRHVKMAVTPSMYPDLVFVPCDSQVFVVEVLTGQMVNLLSSHFTSVYGAVYSPVNMRLYTYSRDHCFITWVPAMLVDIEMEEEEEKREKEAAVRDGVKKTVTHATRGSGSSNSSSRRTTGPNQDNWSSDED